MKTILKFIVAIILVVPLTAYAHASSKTIDAIADWMAIFVIIVVPIAGIAVVLIIHVLPEKIAERNHHPQKAAIQMLCFLSLVFGGLLWPLAWLWMSIKPLGYRMAYGTDKHDDFFIEAREKARKGQLPADELGYILGELDGIAARRILPPELQRVRDELQALQASAPPPRVDESPGAA
jgi:CBS domain containing-hemolysin-like protein